VIWVGDARREEGMSALITTGRLYFNWRDRGGGRNELGGGQKKSSQQFQGGRTPGEVGGTRPLEIGTGAREGGFRAGSRNGLHKDHPKGLMKKKRESVMIAKGDSSTVKWVRWTLNLIEG